MRILTLFVCFAVCSLLGISSHGQHIIAMKNGKSIDGIVEKIVDKVAYINLLGNSIQIKLDSIQGITFAAGKKSSLIEKKEPINFRGVITYEVRENGRYKIKPDVGTRLVFIKKTEQNENELNALVLLLKDLKSVLSCKKLLAVDTSSSVAAGCLNMIESKKLSTDKLFKDYLKKCDLFTVDLTYAADVAKEVQVNGNGEYSLSLVEGEYYIAIFSGNLQLTRVTNFNHLVNIKATEVSDSFDYKF
jgi:hypothetical protein